MPTFPELFHAQCCDGNGIGLGVTSVKWDLRLRRVSDESMIRSGVLCDCDTAVHRFGNSLTASAGQMRQLGMYPRKQDMTVGLAVGSEPLTGIESYKICVFAKETCDNTFVLVVVFPAPCDKFLLSRHKPDQ